MRIPRIHTPQPLTPGQPLALDDNAANHVARVLRMQNGQQIRLFNGDGLDYPGTLTDVGKRHVQVELGEPVPAASESPLRIHLGQTMSRGDRMDYAVQKATELGVHAMTPLHSERCEVRLKGDRQEKREGHWQQVAISACEQSGRAFVPSVHPVQPLEDWVRTVQADLRLVLHHHSAAPLELSTPPTSVALLIGPEGGLTEAEVALAQQAGFMPVAFGNRVFRTETAPVAALSILQWLWGDFRQL